MVLGLDLGYLNHLRSSWSNSLTLSVMLCLPLTGNSPADTASQLGSLNMIGLKYNMSLPMAAGALLVGIPYSISLVAQWMYGWPNKPGYKKYIEALKPRRIYCLTRAVLEMLKYFQYGKLYFQWKSWYKNVENHKHYEKGIRFGRRSNKLDLYYSPTVGQPGSGPVPVVVFIYGGAWGSGERSIYCLLAMQMAKELSATVICPDYCTYPKGNVLCMVQDIADCLIWARDSGHKFNFDKDNIVLIGHSAGAHLAALTVLFMVEGRDELFIDAKKQTEITMAIRGVTGHYVVYRVTGHYVVYRVTGHYVVYRVTGHYVVYRVTGHYVVYRVTGHYVVYRVTGHYVVYRVTGHYVVYRVTGHYVVYRVTGHYVVYRVTGHYVVYRVTGHYVVYRVTGHYVVYRVTGHYVVYRVTGHYVVYRVTGQYVVYRVTGHYVVYRYCLRKSDSSTFVSALMRFSCF
ncbi:uncharacterized protein si:dkey-193c22.1 isoform X1 [Salmo salar]|uniref:Uncharacterized protein si:dkey-193c22.1 isoform X1 n=2 Tax=Salmo salar TaxID=8030 RepID=A0ABM3CXU0_SALSA|nr:uncharacterized protein si:dkey-193c22.1 isoform X1 [Salmo salar]